MVLNTRNRDDAEPIFWKSWGAKFGTCTTPKIANDSIATLLQKVITNEVKQKVQNALAAIRKLVEDAIV